MKYEIRSIDSDMNFYKQVCLQDFEITREKFINQYDVKQVSYFININSLEEFMDLLEKLKTQYVNNIILGKDEIVIYDGYYE